MDTDAEKKKLADEKAWLDAYIEHPVTQAIFRDNEVEQQSFIDLLCNQPIHNIETFFAHFEAVGHLRGLRRAKAIMMDKRDEIQTQLKKLK